MAVYTQLLDATGNQWYNHYTVIADNITDIHHYHRHH